MDASTPKLINGLVQAAQAVKAAQGMLVWYDFFNPGAALAYVQVFDKVAAGVVVGTDVPRMSIGVPAGGRIGGTLDGAGFLTAIAAAATAGPVNAVAPNAGIIANFGIR